MLGLSMYRVRVGLAVALVATVPLVSSCRDDDDAKSEKQEDPFDDYEPDPDVFMAEVDPDRVEEIEDGLFAPVDQLMIRTAEGVAGEDVEAIAESVGGLVVGQIPALRIYQLELGTSSVTELLDARAGLEQRADVLDAVPNVLDELFDNGSAQDYCYATDDNHVNLSGSQRCPFDEIDYYQSVKIYDAIRAEANLQTVRVAVVDTGLELDTGQFDDVPVLNLDNPAAAPFDSDGHGTGVTGIIAADDGDGGTNGIASRMLGPGKLQVVFGGSGSLSQDVVSLYRAGVDARADVVNMSWGYDFDQHSSWWQSVANLLLQPIKAAPDTLFVAAAGNDGAQLTILFPPGGLSSLAENLITVGATARCARETRWNKSNWGQLVDLAAPGEKVPIVRYSPVSGYTNPADASGPPLFVSGTSASAPMVASVAAVLRSIDPNLSPTQLHDYLKYNGYPSDPDLGHVQVLTSIPTMQALLDRGVSDSVRDVIEFEDSGEWTAAGLAVNQLCGGSQVYIQNEGTFEFTADDAGGFWNEMGFGLILVSEPQDISITLDVAIENFELEETYAMPNPVEVAYARADDGAGGSAVSGQLVFTDCAVLERNPLNEIPLQVEFTGKFEGTFESIQPPSLDPRADAFHGTFSLPVITQQAAMIQKSEQVCTGGLGGAAPDLGEILFATYGCGNCHDSGIPGYGGPSLIGLWGTTETLEGGGTVVVDEDYVRESILDPSAKIVEGYEAIMPEFGDTMSQADLDALVEYVESLG